MDEPRGRWGSSPSAPRPVRRSTVRSPATSTKAMSIVMRATMPPRLVRPSAPRSSSLLESPSVALRLSHWIMITAGTSTKAELATSVAVDSFCGVRNAAAPSAVLPGKNPSRMAMASVVKIGQYRTFVMKSAVSVHGRCSLVSTMFLRHISALTNTRYETKAATKCVPLASRVLYAKTKDGTASHAVTIRSSSAKSRPLSDCWSMTGWLYFSLALHVSTLSVAKEATTRATKKVPTLRGTCKRCMTWPNSVMPAVHISPTIVCAAALCSPSTRRSTTMPSAKRRPRMADTNVAVCKPKACGALLAPACMDFSTSQCRVAEVPKTRYTEKVTTHTRKPLVEYEVYVSI
eukprot:3668658-Pleurochrysis_carterae.AAC.1